MTIKKTATKNGGSSKVGALGFEPRASYTPCKRASRTAPRPDFRVLIIAVFIGFGKQNQGKVDEKKISRL